MGFTLMRRPPTRREAWDERTPDGTSIMDIGLPEELRRLVRRRPSMFPPPSEVVETPPEPATPYGLADLQPSPVVAPSLGELRRGAAMFRPEDLKPSRRLPLPGEEAANDEQFARRLAQYPDAAPVVDAGLFRRDRVERPVEFLENRVAEDLTRPAVDHNGGVRSTLLGIGRGLMRGGVAGAVAGGLTHGFDHSLDEKEAAGRLLADDTERYGLARQMEAAGLKAEGDRLSNEVKAAQIPYLLDRPEREWAKINNKQAYDSWRMSSGDRKADSAESYIQWRMQNGDRRATTAEGLAALRAEYVREIQPAQFERTQGERERHDHVTEGQGGIRLRQAEERINLLREGLGLRRYLGEGHLSQGWERIGQGYERMDEGRRKQVDDLSAKGAKAEAQADYFDALAETATDAAKKAEATAGAKMKRQEAESLRQQAEAIHSRGGVSRPAPQVSRPQASTPTRGRGWGEDADVRAYADAHFGGDYGAAQMAIEQQRKRQR